MQRVFGLEIPQTLEEVCDPASLALIVYDMRGGIVQQVANGRNQDACGYGHREAAERSIASLEFAGDSLLTTVNTFARSLERNGRRR